MSKQKYIPTIGSLYFNYIFQGVAAIIISQNMSVLRENWGASLSQVSLVLSAIGLGRILSINFAGILSDRLGRRISIMLGNVSYIIFFVGLLFVHHYILAFVIAIFAGFGNAFLDTGTYPVVVEAFEARENNSALSVLNKAFISIGQFTFPIVTHFLLKEELYYGWSFLVVALCMAVNLFLVFKLPFPKIQRSHAVVTTEKKETIEELSQSTGASFKVEGLALLIFSFVSVTLFNSYITWIPSFTQKFLGMTEANSLVWVSVYSIFSFVSVFLTSFIVKKGINVPIFMMFCMMMTGLSMLSMVIFPSMVTVIFTTFCVGFFAAGGIWQLGLAILLEFFPYKRGLITSYYSLATSISVMGFPYLTGILAEKNLSYIFILICVLAFLGTACLSVVYKRYQKIFYTH